MIYKMIKYEVPSYLIMWCCSFLRKRSFDVRVGDCLSRSSPIEAGVPQGSSISLILFSIFINDIPAQFSNNKQYSTLFADDITAFYFFGKPGAIRAQAVKYIKSIEK